MSISRRRFLESTAVAGIAAGVSSGAESKLPMRPLGKTGAKVPIIAMGCGNRFWTRFTEEDKALGALSHAIDLGIAYLDTAFGYGDGKSETLVGKVMKTRRNEVFLTTKVNRRGGDEAMRMVEGSLKRLQTDHLDVIHIHGLGGADDLAEIEKKGNVLDVLRKFRDQKVTRFMSVTSHTDPETLAIALERHDFDCTQMSLNAALVGMKNGDGGNMAINHAIKTSFEKIALPVALKKKMGVIAMKVYGQDLLVGQVPPEKLLYYSLSLPVASAVVGMATLDIMEQNAKMAQAFKRMPKSEMERLSATLSDRNKVALDRFFSVHQDG
jgi:uncharacterized protein